MLYVLHGEDEFTRSQKLAQWKAKLGDAATTSLNTTVFDGRNLSLPALIEACDALPFMGKRRLVIVEGFWSRFEVRRKRGAKDEQRQPSAADSALLQGLLEYLARLPETTRLVFVESTSLQEANPLFHILPQDKKHVYIQGFPLPSERDLPSWIMRRMKAKGGEIGSQAAVELAGFVGADLRQLDQELDKLLAHANFEHPVTSEDVRCVASTRQLASIFELVDAIGMQQAESAMCYLHELLDAGEEPMRLLYMIGRQFRILIQVKEQLSLGATVREIQQALHISHPFIIEKSTNQARNFSMERLEAIYSHLADVEYCVKSGQITDLLALDVLVAELCA